ncbi:Ig-like domain-containing protein [Patescibacteria group bacterium]
MFLLQEDINQKNNSGTYSGLLTLRHALRESLNIPAVEAIEIIGVTNFLNSLEKLGYTTFTNPENYGAALALGAGDVKLIEHTNAFATFATGGVHHPLSPILKIEDKEGNVIYEYEKDEARAGVRVADERAVYMINDVAKNYHYTPPAGWDSAGKTGTNDNNTNVWYMGYTPEVVTGVWAGNNDNSRMTSGAYGYTVARPIWMDYMNKILPRFTPSTFTRPGGIVSASVCRDSGLLASDTCEAVSDIFIQDKLPEKDNSYAETYRVCKDQTDNLAREIDEQLGYAEDRIYRYIKAPKEEWQSAWNSYFSQGEAPTEYCTINRNPLGEDNPWVIISKPKAATEVDQGEKLSVEATAYASVGGINKIEVYIDSTYITQATNNPFVASITIPGTISNGTHNLIIKAYDESGRSGNASVSIVVGDTVSISSPGNGAYLVISPITISAKHIGSSSVNSATVRIIGPANEVIDLTHSGGGVFNAIWTPTIIGDYTLQVTLNLAGGDSITSSVHTVHVVEDIEDIFPGFEL